jgi:hypothetical protein
MICPAADGPGQPTEFDCGGLPGWKNGQSEAHIRWMAKAFGLRLLEVQLFALKPERWEWRVFHGDTPIKVGYATSRETAQIEADSALFRLLSEGQP